MTMLRPKSKLFNVFAIILLVCFCQLLIGQPAPNRYILFLEDAPAVERFATQDQAQSLAARNYRQQIEARQQVLKTDLAARGIQVTGSVSTLLNAIFVAAPSERVDELKGLPGVKGVVAQRRYRLNLNRATQLVNATAAWTALGGTQSAGAGIKIAMLDTGIDQTHPAFQDNSLKAPTGYPICAGSDCNFTNNKVIVARSYVRQLAAGSDPNNPAADSTPDDYSARDRSGHGTATASAAAGAPNIAPNGLTLTGVAPKAFLGNYKVFGSPLVNDFASDAVLVQALEDAINDHMDIASMSLGQAALTGPLDTGAICGNASGVPCDVLATAVENAIKRGILVVTAAGNDGDGIASYNTPTLGSIETPGNAPSAIAVGATTSSHFMIEGVQVPGSDVPSNLRQIEGALGDGPFPNGALSAPLQDVTQLGDDGLACTALPAGSLNGAFVLIQRGTCSFLIKVNNAQNAGAAGVILYMADQSSLVSPGNLGSTSVPAIMISNNDGVALKSFIDANAGRAVIIDPFAIEQTKSASNLLASFSSLGPTTGDNAIKPDLVATGGSDDFFSDMYLAAQSYDPLGDFYSANRYAAGSGTSFATPLVAGAAALVKQAHPSFSPAQIKSALVNTASQDVTSDEPGAKVGVQQLGGGKLDAAAAIQTTITANPATISFGVPTTLPITKQLQINNAGSSSVNLSLAATGSATGATVTVDQASITLAAGASATIRVTLSGALPAAGSYSGFVTIQNGSSILRVPYLFLVGSGVVDNLIVVGFPSDTGVGQDAGQFAVKLIDAFGVPVSGADVQFSSRNGTLQKAESKTNAYGIATAEAILGSQPGSYSYSVTAAGLTLGVSATAIPQPNIVDGGVLNAASFEKGKPVAPGSYISIFGTALSTVSRGASTAILPLVISGVTVSFDVPSAKISVPGRLVYVSPTQVNLQAPWELQGQTSAQVKVTFSDGFGFGFGNVVTVPLSDYTPAFFEIGGGNVAARDAKGGIIGTGNPAQRGLVVQLYANGLGPVNNQPASGDPAPSSPLANCKSTPVVTIGTQQASVGFCGLAPTFPGLYQLNVTIPSLLTPGTYPITVAIGGQTSKTSNIIVQ